MKAATKINGRDLRSRHLDDRELPLRAFMGRNAIFIPKPTFLTL